MLQVDLILIMGLGFLGSFGHCVGMCSPITVALALSNPPETAKHSRWHQFWFHSLLNLGRLASYVLVGATIGALGSVLVAGGQAAGIGSGLRRGVALVSGGLLIWMGLLQINPGILPHVPLLHPMTQEKTHTRLSGAMAHLAGGQRWWTPALLGLVWGLIPCGFLYTAQIKAAETSSLLGGALTMLAFGLGTFPTMLGVGVSAGWLGRDRRSQLFQLGGWITLLIGILILTRTGHTMVDYTGHLALLCLMLALIARPISRLWRFPLRCRRALGVGAFVLSVAHIGHMLEHSWGWNLAAFSFMLPQHRWGVLAGAAGFALMTPLALTSFDWAQKRMGPLWRNLHLLSIPALLLCALHCTLIGSNYLGRFQFDGLPLVHTAVLGLIVITILLLRSRWFWTLFSLERYYVPPKKTS